jgi:tetratricopeptide (TPR) repeat protein
MEIFNEAINDYSRVISIEPNNTHALYNRAISFDKIMKLNEAVNDFTKIIDLEPMNANAYLNRGCCYEKMQKIDLAYKDYEASLLIDKILENMEQQKISTSTQK